MPSSIDDLIRDLGAETSASSTLELGKDDMRAINKGLQDSPEQKVVDLVAAARRNSTVTNLSLTVDEASAHSFFPVVKFLLRDLPRVTALQIFFEGAVAELNPQRKQHQTDDVLVILHLVAVEIFLERCLQGVTDLASLTVRIPDNIFTAQSMGTPSFDWSIFSQLKGLRTFVFHCGTGSVTMPLDAVMRALSTHEHLERVILRGFDLDDHGTWLHGILPCDLKLISDFLERRSLDTLYLEYVSFLYEISVRSFALGLERSSIKHLYLSYLCRHYEESSLIVTAIAKCTELRTLHLVGNADFVPHRFFPPLVGGATILRSKARLTRLTLSNYKMSDDEARSISAELARRSCVLEYLDVGGCHMSHQSMGILLSSQTAHTCMKDLRLCRSTEVYPYDGDLRIGPQWLDKLMLDHLEKTLRGLVDAPLRSLRVVDLGFRPQFDRERSRAVGVCLFDNYHLETIEIQYLDDECRELMGSLGRLNAAGRRYLQSCRSRNAGVELLGKVSNNITDVFLHLCENPSLCII